MTIAMSAVRAEEAMEAKHQVRRHADGSIDFDFYRREAFLLRRVERTRVFKRLASGRLGGFGRAVIVLAIVALAFAAMPSSARSPGAVAPSGIPVR
jgi:hypothetical protein